MKQFLKSKIPHLFLVALALGTFSSLSAQNLFWSEDFANEIPTDWTNEDASVNSTFWTWCDDPSNANGNGCIGNWIAQNHGDFASETAGNGFALVDSDAFGDLDNNHVTQLTTTAIDCSDQTEVWAKFDGLLGIFAVPNLNNVLLRVSTDNATWTDFNVYESIPLNSWTENPVTSIIDISGVAAGQETVYLQWSWEGNFDYYWVIDDIGLYDSNPSVLFVPEFEIRVNSNFFAISPYYGVPATQVEEFGFLADIENIGSGAQNNINLNLRIVDEGNNEVYTNDLAYNTVGPDSLAENVLFEGAGFIPEGTAGKTYTGTYTLTSDEIANDDNPDNNSLQFQFTVTDSVFAKENGTTTLVGPIETVWGEDENHHWAFGNHFYINNGTTPDGGNRASSATFSIGNATALADRVIFIYLYEWNDDNEDGVMSPSERIRVAVAFYSIVGNEGNTSLITVPLSPFPIMGGPQPVNLNANQDYVLMLEYAPNDQVDFQAAGGSFDYGATTFRSDSLGAPRYANLVGFGDPLDNQDFNTTSFGSDISPVLRLNITQDVIVNTTELSDDNQISLAPNPATKHINLALDLVQAQPNAQIRIMDTNGRLILNKNYNNLQKEVLEFDVSNLASGTYFLQFSTEEGVRTKRFVVQH